MNRSHNRATVAYSTLLSPTNSMPKSHMELYDNQALLLNDWYHDLHTIILTLWYFWEKVSIICYYSHELIRLREDMVENSNFTGIQTGVCANISVEFTVNVLLWLRLPLSCYTSQL